MSEQKQIFKKQVLIIFSAFLVLFAFLELGEIIDYYGYFNYDGFYTVFVMLLLLIWIPVFIPLLVVYIIKLRKGGDLKILNKIYKTMAWFSVIYIAFVFWVGSWDLGIDDFRSFLIIAPLILASGLFYWSIMVNRRLDKIENKLMRNIKKLFNILGRKSIEMEGAISCFSAILFFTYGARQFLDLLFFAEDLSGNVEYIAMSVLLMIIGAYFIIDFYFIKNKVSFRNQLNQFAFLTIIVLLILKPDGFNIYQVNYFVDFTLSVSLALMILLAPLSLVYFKKNNIRPINYIFRISLYFTLASFILSFVVHVIGMFNYYMIFRGSDMANSLSDTIYYSIFSPNLLISLMLLLILISNKKIVGSLGVRLKV